MAELQGSLQFRIMSDFANSVDNESFKRNLIQSLNMPKPFQNFKISIDNSGTYREKWFTFKDRKLFEWVESQLDEYKL